MIVVLFYCFTCSFRRWLKFCRCSRAPGPGQAMDMPFLGASLKRKRCLSSTSREQNLDGGATQSLPRTLRRETNLRVCSNMREGKAQSSLRRLKATVKANSAVALNEVRHRAIRKGVQARINPRTLDIEIRGKNDKRRLLTGSACLGIAYAQHVSRAALAREWSVALSTVLKTKIVVAEASRRRQKELMGFFKTACAGIVPHIWSAFIRVLRWDETTHRLTLRFDKSRAHWQSRSTWSINVSRPARTSTCEGRRVKSPLSRSFP